MLEKGLPGAIEAEYGRLQIAVSKIEIALRFLNPLDHATAAMMQRFVDSAKSRISAIEVESHQKAEEERNSTAQQSAIAAKVQREAALSVAEKEEYGSLLSEEYFTKANFDKIEHFYGNSWDKLTEDGKGEMSHRVWEGVRRKEYEFSELPDIVKEKEAKRLRHELGKEHPEQELLKIPENDRRDFTESWDQGKRSDAYKVLDRQTFADHVALTTQRTTASTVDMAQETARETQRKEESSTTRKETKGNAIGKIDFDLGDVKLVSTSGLETPAPLAGKVTGPSIPAK